MIGDLARRVNELRYLDGVEKVEHVPYRTGDEFWVRFNRPMDLKKLEEILRKYNYQMVRFASLPSKLPRGLAEILWNGVAYVIVHKISQLERLKASVGFEPEGIAKIAYDLHGPYQIFMATNEEGVKVLYDYVGVKYIAPVSPPKPVPTAKAPIPSIAKPATPAVARPVTPTTPAVTPPTAVKPPPQSTALSAPKSTPMSVPAAKVSQPSQSPSPVKPEDSSQKREKKDAPAPSTT